MWEVVATVDATAEDDSSSSSSQSSSSSSSVDAVEVGSAAEAEDEAEVLGMHSAGRAVLRSSVACQEK